MTHQQQYYSKHHGDIVISLHMLNADILGDPKIEKNLWSIFINVFNLI